MIVLNIDRELLRVGSWTDITERPGFTSDLDPSKHTLAAIIGNYAFQDKVSCGLSNCHTPHNKGYIVVTKDGRETNIGRDCGKTYFGVDFETLSNKFDRDMREKENREKLWAFYFRSEQVAEQVGAMRSGDRGADWVYKQLSSLQDIRVVPSKVVRSLIAMVKARSPAIAREREATEDEITRLEAAQGRRLPRPYYVSERLADLAGIESLYPENDLRDSLVVDVSERLKVLTETDIDALSYEQLAKWSRWLGGLDATLERAGVAVRNGRVLLTQANLNPLSDAAGLSTEELAAYSKYLKQLPKEREMPA